MPLTNYAFADLITFTRSTTATFVGSNGLIQSAAINAPRFDFHPVTLAPLGILIEEQRVNLALYSDQFDNAVYIKVRSSITANATTSPDGTATADKLVEDTTASSTHIIQLQAGFSSFVSGTTYVISGYAKAGERTAASISMGADAGVFAGQSASFNFSTGAISGQSGVATFAMVDAGNGWYRWSIAATAAASGVGAIRFSLIGTLGSVTYTGDGTSGLFLWGAQLEVGTFSISYIPIVASMVTRARDVAAITGADFSPWYNANEGTFVVSFSSRPTAVALVANDGSFNNRLPQMGIGATSLYENFIVAGGSVVATLNPSGTHVFGTPATLAVAYAVNNYAASANGGTVVTDTSGVLPTGINNLNMGSFQTGASTINGYLRNITYYPTRLTDAQLQALTA